MAEERSVESINDHSPSRPGILSWLVGGAALVALIIFLVAF